MRTQRSISGNDLQGVAVESFERFAQYKCIIEDCASRWLAEFDSDIGRLVYVSMLRDVSSARYCHPGLEEIYSPPAVHQALLYCHEELFEKVLGHSLELLEWDLRMFFAGIDAPPDEIASRWLELGFFHMFLPLGVPSYLRGLFLSNMAVVLKLIAAGRITGQTAA
ncbi:MAG TPA: hypothetical protein VEX69_00825 [Candidatus Limnocylindria bacterium]|nr:hypothetical protein [Candidatus Limnocylindria bacterium]